MNSNENKEFKPLSFWRELLLKDSELIEYYNQKRKYEFYNNTHLKGMKWRDKLHPILLKLVEITRKMNHQTLTILNDKRDKSEKPVIYAITHVGMYDFQIVSEAIRDHQYVFAGDPETMYRTMDGLAMSLNGVVFCDTESKDDRYIAKETAKDVLNKGKNLVLYPEGVWNLSANLLSLPLFPGIIDIALDTNCDIVPVAVEQYDKDFVVNIGERFNVGTLDNTLDDESKKQYRDTKKEELRNILSTLKWEIMESRPIEERKTIGDYKEAEDKFVNNRLNEWVNKKTNETYYTREIVDHRTFKVKNVCAPLDAFAYLKKLKLNKNNAFCYRNAIGIPNEIYEEMKNDSNCVKSK